MKGTTISAANLCKCAIITVLVFLTYGLYAALSPDQEKLAAANNGFAFQLLTRLATDRPGSNIFISPYSVSAVLQMVGNGAEGQTKVELQRVLGTTGLTGGTVN